MKTTMRQRLMTGAAAAALTAGLHVAPASAACVGPDAAGNVVCDASAYPGGIGVSSPASPPAPTSNIDLHLQGGSIGGSGVSVNTTVNGGTARVDFDGPAAVSTSAAGANGVSVSSASSVTVAGGTGASVTTAGAGSAGFSLSSAAAALRDVTFNFLGITTTKGDSSAGISAQNIDRFGTAGAPNSVGTVSTFGNNSNAVDVSVRGGGPAGASVVITAPNAIQTHGANSNGFDITSPAAPVGASTAVDLTLGGGVLTEGANSKGVNVQIGDGSIAVHAGGGVTTKGANSNAIDLTILGSGSVTVDDLGTISTSALDAKGVVATTNLGNVSVDATGATIATGAAGITATVTGTGDASVDASGVKVTTQADGANGLSAAAATGNAVVAGAGGKANAATVDITTNGASSLGASAQSATGDADVNLNGKVKTKGAGATGVKATVTGTGTATAKFGAGSIDTQGDDAQGLAAANTGTGNATAAADGTAITTQGKNAAGVQASAATGSAVASLSNGSATTAAQGAVGVSSSVSVDGTASSVLTDATVTTSGAGGHGVQAVNSGTGNANVTANGATIGTLGDGAHGANVVAQDGQALAGVDASTVTTAGKNAVGVRAQAGAGASAAATANTSNSSITTAGEGAHAVQAVAANGPATAKSNGDILLKTTGHDAVGVAASNTGTGAAFASATNSIIDTSGAGSHGLQAKTAAGDATVDSTGGSVKTSGVGAKGIDVQATGGQATATAGTDITTSGDGASGVSAAASGGSAIAVTKIGSGATVWTTGKDADGLFAKSSSGGNATASAVSGTTVKTYGSNSAALRADSADGSAAASNAAGSTVTTSGDGSAGFLVRAFKDALATVGEMVSVTGKNAKGVDVKSSGAGATDNATATVAAKVTAGGENGVGVSVSTNAGTAAVTTTADVFATGTGGIAIEALSTTGQSNVLLGGNVAGVGTGVRLGAASGNSLVNGAGFTLQNGLSGGLAAVHVEAGAANIVNNGTMLGNSGALVLANGAAGAVTLNNNGIMSGLMQFTANGNRVFNNAGALWTAKGTSEFGTGDNRVENAGKLRTDPSADGTAQVVFNGLTNLVNKAGGLITMSLYADGGQNNNVNGKAGDSLRTSGNYAAEAGARLGVDAHLGGPGSRSDTLTIDGNVTGATTNIVVNDTNAGPGRYNPGGITVVTVGGSNNSDAFRLAGGPIDKGLWQYDLARYGSGTYKLVTAPSGEVMGAPSVLSQTNRYWQVGQNAADDHRASIRAMITGAGPAVPAPANRALGYTASESNPFDSVFNSVGAGRTGSFVTGMASGTALWGQVVHASFTDNLNNAYSAGNKTWSYDTRTEQDLTRFMGGIDFGAELRGNTALSFGLFGGYGTSDGKMNSTASGGLRGGLSSLALKGTSVGGYAQYLAGPWWIGGSTLYDSLDNTYRIDRVGFSGSPKGSVWGTQIDGGYTVAWSYGSIEPYAAVTYLSTRYDGVDSPWGRFDFGNQDGFDGKLGTRMRIPVWAADAWNATLLGNLAITHAFKDGAPVIFDGFAVPNAKVANWGNIGGGVEVGSLDNHFSGYVKGDWLAASGLNGYSVLGGLNYRW